MERAVSTYMTGLSPEMHRNIFRGKHLGESITDEQLTAIRDGTFDGLYIGDYWEKDGTIYRIADINYWKGVGYQESVQRPHILIVPDTALGSGQMHTSNSTSGGYKSSTMKTVRLNQIANSLPDAFKNILISHRMFSDGTWFTTSVDAENYAGELATVNIRYKDPDGDKSNLVSCVVKTDSYNSGMSADMSAASAVAAYGMLLKNSEYAGAADLDMVLSLVSGKTGSSSDSDDIIDMQWQDFADMVRQTQKIKG